MFYSLLRATRFSRRSRVNAGGRRDNGALECLHRAGRRFSLRCQGGCSQGISLPELILAIGISTAILSVVLTSQAHYVGIFDVEKQITNKQLQLQEAFMVIERDIKSAGGDPYARGIFVAVPLAETVTNGALSGGLRLRTDYTGNLGHSDGDAHDAEEEIIYFFDSSRAQLQRWFSNGSGGMSAEVLVTGVSSFVFECRRTDSTEQSEVENASERVAEGSDEMEPVVGQVSADIVDLGPSLRGQTNLGQMPTAQEADGAGNPSNYRGTEEEQSVQDEELTSNPTLSNVRIFAGQPSEISVEMISEVDRSFSRSTLNLRRLKATISLRNSLLPPGAGD